MTGCCVSLEDKSFERNVDRLAWLMRFQRGMSILSGIGLRVYLCFVYSARVLST